MEWIQTDDFAQHEVWLLKHAMWEHKLHKAVCDIVKAAHFSGEAEYSSYKFHNERKSDECEIFNLNVGQNTTEVKLRKVFSMEKCMKKFVKGTKPTEYTKVFDYTKTHTVHVFNGTKDAEHNPVLSEIVTYSIPTEEMQMQSKTASSTKLRTAATASNTMTTNATLSNAALSNAAASNLATLRQTTQQPTQTGGYETKYLKYKNKYLSLKNQMT
jgi:hypothetical protein